MKLSEQIIYEDQDVVAVNKPSGLLTIPDREGNTSLKTLLQEHFGHVLTVHRLDRDTSGVVVFARNEAMHRHLSQKFETRQTGKIYQGLVLGVPAKQSGVISEPLGEHPSRKGLMAVQRKGKESITEYQVLDSFGIYSWMQFNILTGRTHQIRVHMKHIGHPVVCDELYGDGKPVFISGIKHRYKMSASQEEERPVLSRLALHAAELSFSGMNNEPYVFKAPLPKDLRAALQQLQKWKKK